MFALPHHRIASGRLTRDWPIRLGLPVAMAILLSLLASGLVVFAAGINDAAARKLSDAFMSALIANQVSDAVNLLAPEYIRQSGGPDQAVARMQKFFDYCGRPVDKELVDDEDVIKSSLTGRKVPVKEMTYSSATTIYRKGNCWFFVGVVAGATGLKVGEYGAEHQFAGEI